MFVPWRILNIRHPNMEICRRGGRGGRKRRQMVAEEVRAASKMYLNTYGRPLMDVSSFNYLGRVLSDSYDDWPSVIANLRKAHNRWA